jgi:hypothetical protein
VGGHALPILHEAFKEYVNNLWIFPAPWNRQGKEMEDGTYGEIAPV